MDGVVGIHDPIRVTCFQGALDGSRGGAGRIGVHDFLGFAAVGGEIRESLDEILHIRDDGETVGVACEFVIEFHAVAGVAEENHAHVAGEIRELAHDGGEITGDGGIVAVREDVLRIEMVWFIEIIAVAVTVLLLAEIRNGDRLATGDGAAAGHEADDRDIGGGIDVPWRFFTCKNLACKVIELPEVAAAMAHRVR